MQPSASGQPLVATKLFVPRLRPNRVDRSRLRDRLDQSRHTVLLCAPAGSGKSTLLADWVTTLPDRVAWISLDTEDDDPARFFEYLLSSLRNAGAVTWTGSVTPAAAQSVLIDILNELGASTRAVTLVLDDFHVIESQKVHDIVQFVVDHLPPNLRIIISTRSDPPLTLSRLRARDMLTDIRAADLRFSIDEATRFLNGSMGLQLGATEVAELERRTEGWAVGLQMAAISLRDQNGAVGFIAKFTGSNRYVLDYLTDEVLARQPAEVRQFLLETSILSRLSAPLCNAVTLRNDSDRVLQLLDATNLFLIPLDDVRYWYRYHHLFGTLLEHQLERGFDRQRIAELHQRASDWYLQNGSADEAMGHAAAAEDAERAHAVIKTYALPRLLRGDSKTVLRWLDALPAGEVDKRVNLLVFYGAASLLEFRADIAEEKIARAEQIVTEDNASHERAMVFLTRALLQRNAHKIDESVVSCERAIELLEPGTPWYSVAAFERAMTVMARGNLVAAEKALEHSRGEHLLPYANMTTIIAQCTTAEARLLRGYPDDAASLAEEAIDWIWRWDPDNSTGRPLKSFPCAVLADVHRNWNDLAAARIFAEQGMELGKHGFNVGYFESTKAMLAVLEAESDWEAAERLNADVLRRFIANLHLSWSRTLEWLYQRVLLRRGLRIGSRTDVERVAGAVEKAELLEPPYRVRERALPGFFASDAFVIAARVLLFRGRLPEALELCKELLEFAKERDAKLTFIEVLIIRALTEAASGQLETAVATIVEGLELAAAPRFIRVFADEGSSLAPLIQRALPRISDREFGARLLTAFEVKHVTTSEGLSDREVEVLHLIATGVSNQDAARKLFISPSTVKKHLENIYAKLGVGGRTQAIARARELRLL